MLACLASGVLHLTSWLSPCPHGALQGIFPDPTILDTSDVELVDLKFLEDDPVVVVQFTCQQLNCSRDQCAPGASVSPAWLGSVMLGARSVLEEALRRDCPECMTDCHAETVLSS